jgi:hypothetical protein
MTYRPKTEIALELYDRARAKGIHFAWLTFDEWYGGKPAFLDTLASLLGFDDDMAAYFG